MNYLFVDTFYLLALLHPADEAHEKALLLARTHRATFVSTQWVLTEVADGCADPIDRVRIADFPAVFERQTNVTIVPASDDWFHRGMNRYRDRPDKEWSLTDCISFLVMEDLAISQALTGDHHFEQAGFIALLK